MAARPFQITMDEFRLFHSIDRTLYSLLVVELHRDPLASMQTIALWLWLERNGFKGVIRKILSLPRLLINELADEALTCLQCLHDDNRLMLPNDHVSKIPLTQSVIANGEFSLLFFQDNRDIANVGIRKVANDVCDKALKDIMKKALINRRLYEQTLAENNMSAAAPTTGDQAESSLMGRMARLALNGQIFPREDRTMFVTFSKGYPVAEWEIKEYFTRIFDECIEYILMQEVKPNEQALYARIVFSSPAIIEYILNDVPKAKFTINGKHVWMRKFVPKHGVSIASLLPQSLPGTV